jgi:molybdopterin-synthase adenylyltransferase
MTALKEEQKGEISQRFNAGEAIFDAMIPLLDGNHTLAEIYTKLAIREFGLEGVSQALEHLVSLGLVAEARADAGGDLGDDERRRWARQIDLFNDWLERDPAVSGPHTLGYQAQINVRNSHVMVLGLGKAGTALVKNLAAAGVGSIFGIRDVPIEAQTSLQSAGLAEEISSVNPSATFTELEEAGAFPESLDKTQPSLLIYCPDDFSSAQCIELNDLGLKTSVPFLIYRQAAAFIEIGPLVVPRETACYVCCETRRKAALNCPNPDELFRRRPSGFNFAIGLDLLAAEAVKVLSRFALPVCRGKLWRLNLRTGLSDVHPVFRLPRCPACGVHRKRPAKKLWEQLPPSR